MQSHHKTRYKNAGEKRILLLGNPNVGKSVVFSALTGVNVDSANYPGTTVNYSRGFMDTGEDRAEVIDVPGTYVLDASSEAEKVAGELLEDGADAVICVLDASNLERNLYLTLQILEYGLPSIVVLNLSDVAAGRGIIIKKEILEEELGVPVIATSAVSGQGIPELKKQVRNCLQEGRTVEKPVFGPDYWRTAEHITRRVQEHQYGDSAVSGSIDNWLLHQFWGGIIALVVALVAFGIVVGGGMGLRQAVLQPLFAGYIEPFLCFTVESLTTPGLLRNILIGEYGFIIKSIEWPLTLVFPYVLFFYLALALLEDSGYMPRLAALFDIMFRKMGLQGAAIVPFLLGFGCGVPAIMGTRSLPDRRQRLLVSVLVALGIPCISQTGAFISLLAEESVAVVPVLYLFSFVVIFLTGIGLSRLMPGSPQPLVLELPPLLLPNLKALLKRTMQRLRHFAKDALVPLTLAVAVAALLYETGALKYIGELLRPLVVVWLGLPAEASVALIMGIVRRELAVLPLVGMDLSFIQLFVGAVVALFYLPCIGVFAVLAAEFRLRAAVGVALITIIMAFFLGGALNHLLHFAASLV